MHGAMMLSRCSISAPYIAIVLLALIASTGLACAQVPVTDPCAPYPRNPQQREAWIKELIRSFGFADFHEPAVVRPTNQSAPYELVVQYSKGKKVAGCDVELRSYNGDLVGSTIRARPGDTLYIRLTNKLPDVTHHHPQDPHPADHDGDFSFNITNLHTHGLHTSPSGYGDNVFLEIRPEKYPGDPKATQLYRIHIPDKHPTGTFWYHAHFHGSTGVQVSSGMAGALIIEGGQDANGGLDAVPEIKAAEQKVFVLQQIRFGPDGKLEDFDTAIPDRQWSRNITVNGVFVPTIRIHPGEVQRWRFVHAGVEDNIALALDGHQLHEIAADGLALGRRVDWPAAEPSQEGVRELLLGPGYRSDVLVKAAPLAPGETSKEYFLRDGMLPAALSLQAATAAIRVAQSRAAFNAGDLIADIGNKPQRIIARVLIEGASRDMALPSGEELRDRVPSDLVPIRDEELTDAEQSVRFDGMSRRSCTPDGNCPICQTETPDCKLHFTSNERVFMPEHAPRVLKLGQASKWTITGDGIFPHPFHIHVNPFEVEREEPAKDGKMQQAKLWKDTIILPAGGQPKPIVIRSRYLDYEGEFVMHCHILGHEDMGMMERVKIAK
ncbi:multicopper oxidase family protein [Bradyrhizobium shewense]|nr:multicopper oxidase family protein [Bradyrhizobium shewense]